MQKTIKIYGKEYKTREGTTFTRYSYTKDGEKFYQIKFTKDSHFTATQKGYCLLTIDDDNVSIQKGPTKNGYKQNDIIWIKQVIKFEVDKNATEEYNANKQQLIKDLL